jgi:hypothetical protein
MKILESRELPKTIVKEYLVEVNGIRYRYLDHYNEKNKVIDSELYNELGDVITDNELISEIQNFIDSNE